ncbi:PAS domain-containing hybrid sensor histidine kinase/response regulator [Chondrinema litorale]|uniref:PAS domain-containing hybrid sensor histidine kinase/response regulator n=1 Tax=Chondrinema litorale TaxID=2994555 RepID=UPI0025434313|nr:PAS domain S-box protein [Chondrinema litorale]UZR94531.1 PAS domain S-box protein [Chondrinema litorale]
MELFQKNKEELIEEILQLREKLAKKEFTEYSDDDPNDIDITEYYVSNHFVCKHWLDGEIFFLNDQSRDTFNISEEDYNKANIKDLIPEQHIHIYELYITKLAQSKTARGYVSLIDKDGNTVVLDFISMYVEHENGRPFIRGIGRDVTTKLKKKKWLTAAKEFYKSLFEKNNNIIFLLETDGNIIDINKTGLQFFGLDKDNVNYQRLEDVFEKYDISIIEPKGKHVDDLLNIEQKILIEGDYPNKGKFTLEISLDEAQYYNQSLVVAYCRDVTEEKKIEADNEARYEELLVFNETIRNIFPEKNTEQLLIRSLNIISKLKHISYSCILKSTEEKQNNILYQINPDIDQRLPQLIINTDLTQYPDLINQRRPRLFKPFELHEAQKDPLLLLPIHIESKVEYICCYELNSASGNLTLQLKLLAMEINSRLNEAVFQNKLAVSENRFKTIANYAPSLMRMANIENEFYYYNDQWTKFIGECTDDSEQKAWKKCVYEEDKNIIDKIEKHIENKEPYECIYRLKRNDDQYRWLLEKGSPYYDNKGNYKGFITSAVDIHDRKEKEEQKSYEDMIKYSEERLQNALKNAITFAITIDRNGNIKFCNQFLLDVSGWKSDELVNKSLFEVFQPSLESEGKLRISGFLDTFEGTLRTKKGERLTIRFNSIVLNDQQGDIASMTIVGEDITEQIKVTKALHETNQLLQDLFDGANDLIFIFDEQGKIILVNNTFKDLLDYEDHEIKQINLDYLIDEEAYDETISSLQKAKLLGKLDKFETVFVSKQGKKFNLRGTLSCTIDQNKPYLFRAMLFDYTSSLRAEKAQNLYYQIARLVEKDTPINVLYEKFYELLDQAIGVESFIVALKNPKTKEVSFPFTVNSPEFKETPITLHSFVEYAVSNFKRPMFFYEDMIKKIMESQNLAQTKNIPSVWLGVPLVINEKVVGMIVLQSFKNKQKFKKKDLELLTFVSGQLARTILRFQHEKEINEQSARLEAIFESGSHLMWSVDKRFRLTKFNKNFADSLWQYFHFDPKTMLPLYRTFQDQNPKFIRMWYERYSLAFKGRPQQFEMKFTLENGEEHWREIYLNPIYNKKNQILEVSGVAHDITQKKVTEIGLAESEEKFRNIFESFQDVYFRIDLEGIITMISPSIYELIGEKQIEVLGKPITNYLLNDFKLQYLLRELLKHSNVINFESQIISKDDDIKSTISNFRLIYDKNGHPLSIEGVARDITTLKNATEGLREAKELAEKSLKVKKQFLSNMSHEIRTPMNGIIGMIDLLTETNLNQEQYEYVNTIKKSSETLLNILNDILDLSKIEAGKMELRETTVSIRRILDKLHALFFQQAQVKDSKLVYNIGKTVHDYIIADETRLLQILSNLTSNAIKFTESGEITISVKVYEDHPDHQLLHIDVSDTGIGISQENLNLLFKQFSQVDNSYTKSYGGTGLGLAISKELSHIMGGDIGVTSEINKGSTFWFTIKAQKSAQNKLVTNEEDEISLKKRAFKKPPKVLLVDDNMVNLSVAGRILKKAGCEISIAIGGPDAIQIVQTDIFDMIFMDIQMPGMNGITATKKIRELNLDYNPPIIAMTAFSMQEERAEFLVSGLDDFVAKPIKATTLISKVKKWYAEEDEENVIEAVEVSENGSSNSNGHTEEKSILNISTALELKKYGGDEILVDSYQEFEDDTRQLISQVSDAMQIDDIKEALSLLHTIKGNASTLGVDRVASYAALIEKELKQNDVSNFDRHFEGLKNDFKEFELNYRKLLNI